MYSRHNRRLRVWLAIADIALAITAFYLAYQVRRTLPLERDFEIAPERTVLLLGYTLTVWLGIAFWFRSYDRIATGEGLAVLRETTRQCALGTIAIVIFEYFLRLDLSRPFLLLFGVFCWILLNLFRLSLPRIFLFLRRGATHILIVGTGDGARKLAAQFEADSDAGVQLIGFVREEDGLADVRFELAREYPIYSLPDLPRLLEQHVVDEVVFAVEPRLLQGLEEVFLLCDEDGVRTRLAVDFFPHVNSQIYLDRLGPAPMLTFSATPYDDLRLMVKRTTDVVISIAALSLLAPILILLVILIRITSPGPAIFRQIRCGLNGRRFVFYKFRSMCDKADELRDSIEHLNERPGVVFKIRNDPRLTPVGRWLRRFSLDELPQLWNVLKGDMSIVGPRPPLPDEVRKYERWQRRRLRMRPGLTCLWAVRGRDAIDFETWMKLDMQYIDTWSLALDWKIILRTIPRVLTGWNAS